MPCLLQLVYLGAVYLVFTVRLQQGRHRGRWTKGRPGTDGETSMRQQDNADKCININLQCVKGTQAQCGEQGVKEASNRSLPFQLFGYRHHSRCGPARLSAAPLGGEGSESPFR